MTATTRASTWRRAVRALPGYHALHVARLAGVPHLLRRGRIARRIRACPPVPTRPWARGAAGPAEVHVLVRGSDAWAALWSLASFYRAARVDWPLVFHQGGPINRAARARLARQFPASALLDARSADALVEPELAARGLAATRAARRGAVMLRKLVDPIVLSGATSLLVLDTDVLFFRTPGELLDAAGDPGHANLFNRDAVEWAYNLTPDEARRAFGVAPVNRVNAGLALLRRASIDLARVDALLAEPAVTRDPFFAEQTVHGLLAAETAHRLLAETYACSTRPGLTTPGGEPLVAKHYVQTPRPLLYEEGMRALDGAGLCAPQGGTP